MTSLGSSDSEPMAALRDACEPMAALRDASGYRTHRLTDTATMQHIPSYHVVNPDNPYLSRCGRLIVPDTQWPAASVARRCQRPGCKQAWPDA